jgi:ElaB/YqjD/DUF883 family membrane-anchored ribosome-binding protein
MADPLHNTDFPEPDTRTSAPIGTGLEADAGNTMAYQPPLEDPIRKGDLDPHRELPSAGNPRLNRTAEQIGGTIGKVVSQAKRAPDTARRGLHLVRGHAQDVRAKATNQIATTASSLTDNAQQRAREIADKAQQRGRELLDAAEERGRVLLDKADDLTQNVAQRTGEIRQQLEQRTRELQQAARVRTQQARITAERLVRERPLHVLGGIAAASFILGVSLRIVRSRNASRY